MMRKKDMLRIKALVLQKEEKAIEYFNEVLLNISQLKGGEHNG